MKDILFVASVILVVGLLCDLSESGGPPPDYWKLEVLGDYETPLYFEEVLIWFQNESAKRHFKARLVADPELADQVMNLFNLIDTEQVQEIGEDRVNEFLMEVMAGAERMDNKQYRYEKR